MLGVVGSVIDLCSHVRTLFSTMTSKPLASIQYELHNICISVTQKTSKKYGGSKNLTVILSLNDLQAMYSVHETDRINSFFQSANQNPKNKIVDFRSKCQNDCNKRKLCASGILNETTSVQANSAKI